MNKTSIGVCAIAGLLAATTPALARHHHSKPMSKQSSTSGKMTTEQLNAMSLKKSQMPASSTQPASAPAAMPTTPTPGQMPSNTMSDQKMPSSQMPPTMPANAPGTPN